MVNFVRILGLVCMLFGGLVSTAKADYTQAEWDSMVNHFNNASARYLASATQYNACNTAYVDFVTRYTAAMTEGNALSGVICPNCTAQGANLSNLRSACASDFSYLFSIKNTLAYDRSQAFYHLGQAEDIIDLGYQLGKSRTWLGDHVLQALRALDSFDRGVGYFNSQLANAEASLAAYKAQVAIYKACVEANCNPAGPPKPPRP